MRYRDVWEVGQERLVVAVNTVADEIVRGFVWQPERVVHDRTVTLRDRAQFDVHHVVFEPPAVRESGEITGENTQPVAGAGHGARRDGGIQAQEIGGPRTGEVQAGHAGQQDGGQVGPIHGIDRL